jgi:uncharacterized protein (TIGR02246 family)
MTDTALQLEQRYWDAVKRRDGKAIAELTADNCVVVGAQGISELRREEVSRMMEDSSWQVDDFRLDAARARVQHIGDDVLAISYPVHEQTKVNGSPAKIDAFDTSVWVKRDGKWRCALHSESIASPEG